MGSQRVRCDWTTYLNWLNYVLTLHHWETSVRNYFRVTILVQECQEIETTMQSFRLGTHCLHFNDISFVWQRCKYLCFMAKIETGWENWKTWQTQRLIVGIFRNTSHKGDRGERAFIFKLRWIYWCWVAFWNKDSWTLWDSPSARSSLRLKNLHFNKHQRKITGDRWFPLYLDVVRW